MTTSATKLERESEAFSAFTAGTSACLAGLELHECPYPSRTLKADCWELGFGRASQARVSAITPANTGMQTDAQTCQIIVEDVMSFMGSADMLVGCDSERRVHIRNKLFSIVAGKLLHA